MGSIWGNQLNISIFGESHGKGIGVVIDGFPAGFRPDMEAILRDMARRAPGRSTLTTGRREADLPEILSGMLEGVTTGAPLCALIANQDTRSKDYEGFRQVPRPSHSDYTGGIRYGGFNDLRGSGHFSGRLTAPLVFAGALCRDYLKQKHNVHIGSHLYQVGKIYDHPMTLHEIEPEVLIGLQGQAMPLLDRGLEGKISALVDEARRDLDSVGGVIECAVVGVNPGLGSPMFENVESRMAGLLYGIPAVKGLEFGLGFGFAEKRASEVNDCFALAEDQRVKTKTNANGGILGGITTGMPIVMRVALKPTPSIAKPQQTVNLNTGEEEQLEIHGRHDPCIALRAPVVIEACTALVLTDLYLEAYGYEAE